MAPRSACHGRQRCACHSWPRHPRSPCQPSAWAGTAAHRQHGQGAGGGAGWSRALHRLLHSAAGRGADRSRRRRSSAIGDNWASVVSDYGGPAGVSMSYAASASVGTESARMSVGREMQASAAAAAPRRWCSCWSSATSCWNATAGRPRAARLCRAAARTCAGRAGRPRRAREADRATWERRVPALRTSRLDRDALDERARAMLNLSDPSDIIVPYGRRPAAVLKLPASRCEMRRATARKLRRPPHVAGNATFAGRCRPSARATSG